MTKTLEHSYPQIIKLLKNHSSHITALLPCSLRPMITPQDTEDFVLYQGARHETYFTVYSPGIMKSIHNNCFFRRQLCPKHNLRNSTETKANTVLEMKHEMKHDLRAKRLFICSKSFYFPTIYTIEFLKYLCIY